MTTLFVNPDNLPVEAVTLIVTNDGVVKKVKALDSYWVDYRQLMLYEPPPTGTNLIPGALEVWKQKMKKFIQDLEWLLSLEYHRFWSTVIYHNRCMDMLVSFVQEGRPPYLRPQESIMEAQLFTDIRRLVLIVFSRLVTNKESQSEWMSKEHLGTIIYDHFIFTVPVIWDICLMFGADNKQHVSKLLTTVLTLQPKYEADIANGVMYMSQVFKFMIQVVNEDYEIDGPPTLPEGFLGFAELHRQIDQGLTNEMSLDTLKDLIVFLLDCAMTLRIFVETCPAHVGILRRTHFVNSIVEMYEYGIPKMYDHLEKVCDTSEYDDLERYLDYARVELMYLFSEMLAGYKNAVLSGEGNIVTHVEDYLGLLMDALTERLFIRDYHTCYPVHEDIDLLREAYPEIDTVKTDFILQAVFSNIEDPVHQHTDAPITNGHHSSSSDESSCSSEDEENPDETPENMKMETLIKEVKDIFPTYGDGFIIKCLEHYGYDSGKVLNCILESNLAESLRDLDTSLPRIPEDNLDKHFLETGIERLNVFDGDEFDIMTRDDVDLSRIHVGKKPSQYTDLNDMLNDKMDLKERTDIYEKYNLVYDDNGMYSDEYDDSYDGEITVPMPGNLSDEPRRRFVKPRVLRGKTYYEQDIDEEEYQFEEEEEEDEAQPSGSRNKMDFCVNPEEVRARREASYQARRGRTSRPPPARNANVTGKPRGQGQEKDVLVNRDRKEKHKSSRGNHSRRQGAQHKRNQGMMPS